jgi:hypothetical protein
MEDPSRRRLRSGLAEQLEIDGLRFGGRGHAELLAQELAAALENAEGFVRVASIHGPCSPGRKPRRAIAIATLAGAQAARTLPARRLPSAASSAFRASSTSIQLPRGSFRPRPARLTTSVPGRVRMPGRR